MVYINTTFLNYLNINGALSNEVLFFLKQYTDYTGNRSIVHVIPCYVLSSILFLKQVCMNLAVARITTGSADDNKCIRVFSWFIF